jgi:glutamine synthetase
MHHVFSESELRSQYEILMENYCKVIHIEALTMVDMVKGEIMSACIDYQNDLTKLLERKRACGEYDASLEEHLLGNVSKLSSVMLKNLSALESALFETKEERDILSQARFYRDRIFTAMIELRLTVDELETFAAKKHWPFPSYGQILYSVV